MSTSSERAARSPRARQAVAVRGSGPVVGWLLIAGCSREAEDLICPDVGPGDLVITEIRGPQSSPNSLPQWIEFANVSGRDIDLQGLHLELQRPDGSGPLDMIVRYKRPLPAADYYVLGLIPDTMLEGGVDYGLGGDYDGDLYEDGLLDLVSCGEQIDRVDYEDLPEVGTRSLGVMPPDAEANDAPAAWCVDDTPTDGPTTELGIPGTPGEENRPCD
jgi:hypothetical protein